MENHISPAHFSSQDDGLRRQLRFGDHHFEHGQLNSVHALLEKTAEHLGGEHTSKNHEKAMEFMTKQAEWKSLAPGKQQELRSVIETHLGIEQETKH